MYSYNPYLENPIDSDSPRNSLALRDSNWIQKGFRCENSHRSAKEMLQ